MSTPKLAASGTELTVLPPSNVPTFIVGLPITGCAAGRSRTTRSRDSAPPPCRIAFTRDSVHGSVRRNAAEPRVELERALVPDVGIVRSRSPTIIAPPCRAAASGEMLRPYAPPSSAGREHDDEAGVPGNLFAELARREQESPRRPPSCRRSRARRAVAVGSPANGSRDQGSGAERHRCRYARSGTAAAWIPSRPHARSRWCVPRRIHGKRH